MNDNYELFLKSKKEEIRQRVLGKYGIDSVPIGKTPRTGRIKDEKSQLICDVFNLNRATLKIWKSGKAKHGRQKLYALLMSLPFEVLEHLNKMENVEWELH